MKAARIRKPFVLIYCLAVIQPFLSAGTVSWKPLLSSDAADWNQSSAIKWLSTLGSPNEDWINRVIETADGGIAAAGYIGRNDALKPPKWTAVALKYSATGELLWSSAFGGKGVNATWAVREARDGRFVLGGFSSSESAGEWDAYLVILDAKGNLQLEKRFGGPKDDRATDVLLTRDGNALLVGETRSMGAGERDVFLVKTDLNGKELWRKAYGGPDMDRGFAAVETSDGGVVVTGATGTDKKHDGLVFKVDTNGNQLWRTLISADKNVTPHFVNLLPSGKIVVIGYTDSWGAIVNDYFAATISPEGSIEKLQTLGGADDDRAMTSATDARGGSWIIGYTKSFGAKGWDIMIARVGSDGTFEPSVIVLGTPYADNGTTIAEARNGDLLIGGYTDAPSRGKSPPDLLVMRLDPRKAQWLKEGVVIKTVQSRTP
jgi:hypothetical protein